MSIWNALSNLLSTGITTAYQVKKDQQLTGAEREANAFSAQQAELARQFEAQQADIARDWQESQYLKYNSPEAMVRQYQDAGLNPALMYQSSGGSPASTVTSVPSSPSPSSVSPQGAGNIAETLANMSMLAAQIQNIKADTANKQASARSSSADAVLKEIDANTRPLLNSLGIKSTELSNKETEVNIKLKEIESQYKPQLLQQEFERGEVNIEQMKLGCEKAILEMNLLRADELKVIGEVELQDYTKALMIAQKVAANASARNMNAQAFETEWRANYQDEYGYQPGANGVQIGMQTLMQMVSDLKENGFKSLFKIKTNK